MAITFTGTAIGGNRDIEGNEYVFVIDNTAFSRVKVIVNRVVAYVENIYAVSTAITPLLRIRRVTGVSSGGIILPKRSYNTTQTSHEGVVVRAGVARADSAFQVSVTGTPEAPLWQTFTSRRPSSAEQQIITDFFVNSVHCLECPLTQDIILTPGQALVVELICGAGGGNTLATNAHLLVGAFWMEDDEQDAGYTLSGTVTLNNNPVSGAKVILVTDLNPDLPNPRIEVINTNAQGQWSKTLASGVKASAFVQHQSGGTKYTDEGKPYLEKT